MQKIYLILVISVMIVGGFFAVTARKKSHETFVFWTIQLKPVATAFIEKNISEFEKKHPEIKVVWVDIPISEAQKRALAGILGGNPPDLINLNPDFSILLAKKGALEFFDENEAQDFIMPSIESLKYQGKIYALPFYATSPVTLYNKKCLSKPPKTYDDVLKINCKCQNTFAINLVENDTLARILNKYGIYDTAQTAEINKVLLLFKNMYDGEKIPKDSVTLNHREVVEKYMTGDVGAIVAGANFVKTVKENALDVYNNSDVATQMTGTTGLYDVSLMNFVIPVRAKNKDMAREFLAQLLSKKNQIEFAKLTNVLATNKYALQDEFFKCDKNADLIDKARCMGAMQLQNLNIRTFDISRKKEINDELNLRLEKKLLTR